nr:hypothetical protein [Paraburkholderia sp. J94]
MLKLNGVAHDAGVGGVELRFEPDVAPFGFRRDQFQRAVERGVERERAERDALLLQQAAQALHDFIGAQGVALHVGEDFPQFVGVEIRCLDQQFRRIGIAQNRAQRLPDFMRDRCAQFADGGEARRTRKFVSTRDDFGLRATAAAALREQRDDRHGLRQQHGKRGWIAHSMLRRFTICNCASQIANKEPSARLSHAANEFAHQIQAAAFNRAPGFRDALPLHPACLPMLTQM